MTAAPSILRNRWYRILGVSFVMYVLSYMDRTNIAMAIPAMRAELGMAPSAIGLATGMFFWGYIVLQVPAGRLASIWSAKRVIGTLLVFWSLVSVTTAFVHTGLELFLNRFALGIAEGGVLTCVIVLIRSWFTQAERARANTVFLLSLAVGPLVANPVSGWIIALSGWRLMFVLEALPGLLWGIVWWLAIDDDPRTARWLDPAEQARLVATLDAERADLPPLTGHWLKTLYNPAVLLLAAYNFLALMAEWGVQYWLPSVLKDTGLPISTVGMLAAIPYLLGIAMMLLVAASSDRLRERKWHMVATTALAGAFLIMLPFGDTGPVALICFLTLSIGAFMGRYGPFWTLPTEALPTTVVGVGIGLVNGAGNLGGTVGPYFFGVLRTQFGDFKLALAIAGISLILASLTALPIRARRTHYAAAVTTA
jgi:sugar phosphate permease